MVAVAKNEDVHESTVNLSRAAFGLPLSNKINEKRLLDGRGYRTVVYRYRYLYRGRLAYQCISSAPVQHQFSTR
jgi:hypothetical protein